MFSSGYKLKIIVKITSYSINWFYGQVFCILPMALRGEIDVYIYYRIDL